MKTQQIAGYKAAFTRKIAKLDEAVRLNQMTRQQAAGHKAAARKRLNQVLADA